MPVNRSLGKGEIRRGNVAVFVAVCMVVLLATLAVAVDGGTLLTQRRQGQAVADAAALAAAADLYDYYWSNSGKDPSDTAKASAIAYAAANGYANDGVRSTVTVNIPPKSGDYEGLDGYVEVLVRH